MLAFVGDGNNVYHSLAMSDPRSGIEVRLAHPPGYAPECPVVERARERPTPGAGDSSSRRTRSKRSSGADVVYTDAWTSMGQEAEAEERRDAFRGYQVNDALLDAAGSDVWHALPACAPRRGDHLGGHGRTAEPDL